ncbi:lactosylceramide 1,3-N-acetyl-beta-D-glucosaminyltransferase A-like isoform X2 [Gigantopelta aegis]|uniref:lactosylceramide 1,3-N-acetyl-beta-D-glucosaminyltransferase A-like isoform X2 n=1 Tax=Gigantopelta aegis TaxID=1735272 RepID=UPI001B88DCF6|nr:lactosylceramide 1,3-N-acetyl-beta-D-glucosaminyltransferase A-like isoform X2 [Gigantopelta aegis]
MSRFVANRAFRELRRRRHYVVFLVVLAIFIYTLSINIIYISKKQLQIRGSYDATPTSDGRKILNNSDATVYHGPLPYYYKYDINQIHTCNSSIKLLIFVFSAPYNKEYRDTIRTTWASKPFTVKYNAKVLFLFGMDPHEGNNSVVESENERHHDVVRANFVDSYENLTLKSLAMLNWVLTYCSSTKYLLKSDDDVYVNTPVLLDKMRRYESVLQKFLIGRIHPVKPVPREGDIPKPEAKWIISRKEYSEDLYPAYLKGSAYAMTRAALPDLYAASMEVHYIKIEDVFLTGLCANKAGITRIQMKCLRTIHPCKLRQHAISRDSLSVALMNYFHQYFQNSTGLCKT